MAIPKGNRFTKEFQDILDKVEQLKLKEFISLIAPYTGKGVEERQSVAEYDKYSGKPKKYKWDSYPWDGKLKLAGIKKKFPEDECIIVNTDDGPVVVYHVPTRSDYIGTSPGYLLFKRPIRL